MKYIFQKNIFIERNQYYPRGYFCHSLFLGRFMYIFRRGESSEIWASLRGWGSNLAVDIIGKLEGHDMNAYLNR